VGILEPLVWGLVAATLILSLSARRGAGAQGGGGAHVSARFLIPLVLLAAHWGLKHRLPHVPAREALDWTIWAALGAAFLPNLWGLNRRLRLASLTGIVLLVCTVILRPRMQYLPMGEASLLLVGSSVFWLAASFCVKPGSRFLLERLLIVTTGAAVCLSHSFAGASLIAGALCFALGGAWLLSRPGWGRVPDPWILVPWLLAVGGLVVAGLAFGELAPLPAACLALSVCVSALGRRLGGGRTRRPGRDLLLVAVLVAAANWLAWPAPSAGHGQGDYGYSVAPDGPPPPVSVLEEPS